jgi:hypothetical protein
VETPGDYKIIMAIRTDYYGLLTDVLRRGLRDLRGVRDYLLTDLDPAALKEAILLPTSEVQAPRSESVPGQKYQFSYAPGVAEQVAREAVESSRTTNDSALLLMQLTCSKLYDAVRRRDDKVVRSADVQNLGGVAGGMRAHAEALLDDYFHGAGPNDLEQRGRLGPIHRPHLSTRFLPVNGQPPRVACSVPINDGRTAVGVLSVTLDPRLYLELPMAFGDEDRLILFVDRNGGVAGRCGCGDGPERISEETRQQLRDGQAVVRGLGEGEGEGPWVAGWKPVRFDHEGENDPGWSVVVAEPEKMVLKPLARLRLWALVIGAAALVLVLAKLVVLIPLLARRLGTGGLLMARGVAEPQSLTVTVHGPGGLAWQGQAVRKDPGDRQ